MANPIAAKEGPEPLIRHLRRNALMDPAIEIRGLSKHFGKKKAVAGVGLDEPPGGIFPLLGENGAGQNTNHPIPTLVPQPAHGVAAIPPPDLLPGAAQTRSPVP